MPRLSPLSSTQEPSSTPRARRSTSRSRRRFADGQALIYSATNLPFGLSIQQNTGLISGTLESIFSQHGPYTVTISVSDASLANTTTISFIWTVGNLAPTVTNRVYAVPVNGLITVSAAFGVLSGSADPGHEALRAVLSQLPATWDRVAE